MNRIMVVTVAGRKKKEQELDGLYKRKMEVLKDRKKSREFTDSQSDNPAFSSADEECGRIAQRIASIEDILKCSSTVDPIEVRKGRRTHVQVGSLVRLLNLDDERVVTWEVVGYCETDVHKLQIGYNTPLGSALLGKELGAEFDFTAPNGTVSYEIIGLPESRDD
jgi:transcription elongation factor GreA